MRFYERSIQKTVRREERLMLPLPPIPQSVRSHKGIPWQTAAIDLDGWYSLVWAEVVETRTVLVLHEQHDGSPTHVVILDAHERPERWKVLPCYAVKRALWRKLIAVPGAKRTEAADCIADKFGIVIAQRWVAELRERAGGGEAWLRRQLKGLGGDGSSV